MLEGFQCPRFYTLIISSFQKIEATDFNSQPCFFNLVKLGMISLAAHFLNCQEVRTL